MRTDALVFAIVLDDAVERGDRAWITGLAQPEHRRAAGAKVSVPREIDERRHARSVVDKAERSHRRGRETFHARSAVIFVDIIANRTRSAPAGERNQCRNYLRIAEESYPLKGLPPGLLRA